MKSFLFISLLILAVSARFFDACPGRRISIGACLAGLCPAGSECVNGYCCKLKNNPETTTPPAENSSEVENYEKCKNGKHAIGECISDNCPSGYKCEDGLCCKVGLPPVRVTMIPVELATTRSITESVNISTKSSKKGKTKTRVIPEGEEEEGEQSLGKRVQKKKGSGEELTETESEKTKEEPEETSTNEEDYGNELIVEDREEVEQYTSTTTTTTTTVPTTTLPETTTRRKKAKKSKVKTTTTTSTTPQPVEEEEEEQEEVEAITEEMEFTTSTSTKSPSTTEAPAKTTKATPEEENISLTGCPVGESIGECISNECPEGHGCFQNKCCIMTPQINCTDALSGCLDHLCQQRGYKEFMTKKCARTCARCHLTDLDTAEIRECRDRRTDCGEWAQEGFCESTLYTTRQKLKMCGKSCKLC
ncbi:unnamed protein product [Auanema sp. JU1783]|nr:unnamed protein product [Auanema sp. JU1783]